MCLRFLEPNTVFSCLHRFWSVVRRASAGCTHAELFNSEHEVRLCAEAIKLDYITVRQ